MRRRLRAPFCVVMAAALGGCGAGTTHSEKVTVVPTPIPVPPGSTDRDGDGIADGRDQCPDDPEDKDGFQDEDGCPDPDNDHDGILDAVDKCPNEPETYNGFQDEDGCPDKGTVVITTHNPPVVQMVLFSSGSSTPNKEAMPILDAVAAVMKSHPEITLVQLEGHADDPGKPDAQVKLSQSRADAVKKLLVDRGVDDKRLRAKGFGTHCPRDEKDKAGNRRVQFKVAKVGTDKRDESLGCAAATKAGIVSDPVP